MNTTAKKSGAEAPVGTTDVKPIEWNSKKVWGAVGLTHYAEIIINDDVHRFTLDQPRQHEWVARGWTNGTFCLYRDGRHAKTLRGMKDVVAAYVADLRDKAAAK